MGVKLEEDDETKEDVARVIMRSRVCPESWVGKVICCLRPKTSSSSRKGDTVGSVGWSQ